MKGNAGKIQMTTYDDLFQTGDNADSSVEKVQEIALSELFPFKNHPFQVQDDEDMQKTSESIAEYGVLVPAIARPRAEGGYELIAAPIAAEVFGIAALEQVTGQRINYRLACDRTYSATEIALECGVSANKIGKTANANHLKTEEYGITISDTAANLGKAVPNFRYNEKGRERL